MGAGNDSAGIAGAGSVPPLVPQRVLTVRGSYVGDLNDITELMALVKSGKVPPIPVKARPLAEINQVLDDLRAGKVLGRVVVKP